jgi:hypothetical protein
MSAELEPNSGQHHSAELEPNNRSARAPQAVCVECARVFDLTDSTDSEEWSHGHDCEA